MMKGLGSWDLIRSTGLGFRVWGGLYKYVRKGALNKQELYFEELEASRHRGLSVGSGPGACHCRSEANRAELLLGNLFADKVG